MHASLQDSLCAPSLHRRRPPQRDVDAALHGIPPDMVSRPACRRPGHRTLRLPGTPDESAPPPVHEALERYLVKEQYVLFSKVFYYWSAAC